MSFVKLVTSTLAALAISFSAASATIDVGGVKIEDSIDLQGSKLQLNGAGVRYRAVFKVYTAGLYLGKKASTPEEVFAAPGPKRMSITLLRDVDANELGKAFTKGFEDNSPKAEMSKPIPGLIKMGQIFSDQKKMVAGKTLPSTGFPARVPSSASKANSKANPLRSLSFTLP